MCVAWSITEMSYLEITLVISFVLFIYLFLRNTDINPVKIHFHHITISSTNDQTGDAGK